MPNDEQLLLTVIVLVLLLMIDSQGKFSITITSMTTSMRSPADDALPTLSGIGYWRKGFAKVSLLALGFFFLIRLASLLLGTRTRTTAK